MNWIVAFLSAAALAPASEPLFDAIRSGNHSLATKLLARDAGPNRPSSGMTPLLHAVITSDLKMVKLLLAKGADAKAAAESGVTPLHGAVFDLELTRVLLEAGANANAEMSNGRTPLFGAVSRRGSLPVVDLLLKHGANVNAPLLRRALASRDPQIVKRLLEAGADAKAVQPLGRPPMQGGCVECVRSLIAAGFTPTAQNVADAAAPGSLELVKLLVEAGAPVNGQDARGYTPLMRAALSYTRNEELVAYLLSQGADIRPKNETGDTALSIAHRYGPATPIAARLEKSGATGPAPGSIPDPVTGNTVRAAIERGVPLLERIGDPVYKRRACVTCHNNMQPAMVVAMAARRGFAINEEMASIERRRMVSEQRRLRQALAAGTGIPEIMGYLLFAFDVIGEKTNNDLAVHQLAFRQEPDGYWRVDDYRPPQEYSPIAATALAIRSLQAYAPPGRAAEMKERIARAGKWIAAARPHGAEEHAMRLMGLGWARQPRKVIDEAIRAMESEQRPDGGWSQLPGMESDAYAAGLALYALHTGGGVPVSNPVWQRGVRYLLDTQRPDGSWFVQTRSYPFQPYFESGFPYGHSQWISAAGSSWALMSLLLTVPEVRR